MLNKLIQKLFIHNLKGVPIIVEGKKDLAALRKLGINGEIICIKNSSKILVDLLDKVQSKEVALFVDFDDDGVSLAKEVKQYLEGKGVKVNSILWRKARSLFRRDICEVEGFPTYLEKLKKRATYS